MCTLHIISHTDWDREWYQTFQQFRLKLVQLVDNLLEGKRTASKFGSRMMIGDMPDSFRHIGQMPQILRGFGIEKPCLWRGMDEQPAEFWWQAWVPITCSQPAEKTDG